jgi:hypothetical protein
MRLNKLFVWRCEECGKHIRYSAHRYKAHLQIHEEDRLPCPLCPTPERLFTREQLKAHQKKAHRAGQFWCEEEGCGAVYETKSELRIHQRNHQER